MIADEYIKRHEKKLEKARLNKTSFMSNSKWEKLFHAVANSGLSLFNDSIKYLTDDTTRPFSLKEDGLYWGGRYSTVDGGARGGVPVPYKEIEWIFVPTQNDILTLKDLIDGLGLYEYDFNEDGLKIYGYK